MKLYEKKLTKDDDLAILNHIKNQSKVDIAHEIILLIAYYEGRLSVLEAREKLREL
jgi:hypothetical protein